MDIFSIIMANISIIEKLRIPKEIGILLFGLCLALLLIPYFPGLDFGVIRVPDASIKLKKILKFLSPILLFFSILLFVPIIPDNGNLGTGNNPGSKPDINFGLLSEYAFDIYHCKDYSNSDKVKKVKQYLDSEPSIISSANIVGRLEEKQPFCKQTSNEYEIRYKSGAENVAKQLEIFLKHKNPSLQSSQFSYRSSPNLGDNRISIYVKN